MAIETAPRSFSFHFSDLAVVRDVPDLSVLESDAGSEPGDVALLEPAPRPRWLPRLLPVFRAGDPLRVGIRAAGAPAFAARVADSLARLYSAAGAGAGVRVGTWPGGFAVTGHGTGRVAAQPHAQLVTAELEPASVTAALAALEEVAPPARWLVLHGNLPSLEPLLGLEPVLGRLGPGRVVRLPLFERGDLAAALRGSAPGLARRRTGLAFLDLAVRLVLAYLSEQP